MTRPRLQRAGVHRIACAVVASEVRRLRKGDTVWTGPNDWSEATPIGEDEAGIGLGLDSLEQLGALGALAETFDLDDSLLGREPPCTVGGWIDWIMAGHAGNDGRITVRTSGSTGHPLPCIHVVADLLDEAAYLAAQLGARRRVVALVPAHHLYGMIWTALLPDALDVPVVVRMVGTPLDLLPGDLVVAVPNQWQGLQRLTRRFPEDVIGVSSAGPLEADTADALLAAGLARLVDVYGSSETGAIGLRDLPARDYVLLPRWTLAGDVDGDDWYLVDPTGTRINLPDHIERTGERALRPIGRRDGAVQVGGHNVWPDRVARLLQQADGVADAAVRLHTNGRLKAFIVPVDGHDRDSLSTHLDHVVATRLTSHERPRMFRFGASLPRNTMGKLEDWT